MGTQKSLRPSRGHIAAENGSWYTREGKRILDFSGQTMNLSFGQPPEKIRRAVVAEIEKHVFFSSRFGSAAFDELGQTLIDHAPPNITGVNHKLTDGSDAVETALKIGRSHVRSLDVIALKNAWHGETMATLSLSNRTRSKYLTSDIDVTFSESPELASLLEAAEAARRPSTVIVDPIGFSSGLFPGNQLNRQLSELSSICKRKNHFLVFDEVQVFGGFLNGKLFSYDEFGIECDAIAIGKALGQGFPIAACLYSSVAAELLYNEAEFTSGGQPPACRAAIAGIRHFLNSKLEIQNSLDLWNRFLDELIEVLHPDATLLRTGFVASINPTNGFKRSTVQGGLETLWSAGLVGRKGNSGASLMLKAPILFDQEMYSHALAIFTEKRGFLASRPKSTVRSASAALNPAISYIGALLQHFPGIALDMRDNRGQFELVGHLHSCGVPVPECFLRGGELHSKYIAGISLDKYQAKSQNEALQILTQVMDYVIKSHDVETVIGDRWPGNSIWDGSQITFIDFDVGFTGELPLLKAFEHLFCLFHHACAIPADLGRREIVGNFIGEAVACHGAHFWEVYSGFQAFYGNPNKPENDSSLATGVYQEVLREFEASLKHQRARDEA